MPNLILNKSLFFKLATSGLFFYFLVGFPTHKPMQKSVEADSNTYTNAIVGFSVTKPQHWHFMSKAQYLKEQSKIKFTDEELMAERKKYTKAPLVVITKYREPYDDLNPDFTVNFAPLETLKHADAKKVLEITIGRWKNVLKDYAVVQPPKDTVVSGLKAAYGQINYTLESVDGRKIPIIQELWIIPRSDYYFGIISATRKDGKTEERAEIRKILSTVKIESSTDDIAPVTNDPEESFRIISCLCKEHTDNLKFKQCFDEQNQAYKRLMVLLKGIEEEEYLRAVVMEKQTKETKVVEALELYPRKDCKDGVIDAVKFMKYYDEHINK